MLELNKIINQIDLTDIYKAWHPKTREYTFFSAVYSTLSKVDHIQKHTKCLKR